MGMKTKQVSVLIWTILTLVGLIARSNAFFLPGKDNGKTSSDDEWTEGDVCATVLCGRGRECVRKSDTGAPSCVCRTSCPPNYKPVCGSDGITYENHCQLHRSACLQSIKIKKLNKGPCPGHEEEEQEAEVEETQVHNSKPLVCYEIERDLLRQLLIDWMKSKVVDGGWFTEGKTYGDVVRENFLECDFNKDDRLDAGEFMSCVEKNDTIANLQGSEDQHMLRGLCVDALILMSDANADWFLDLEEFRKCFDPEFEPPKKKCSLEAKMYADGAETRVGCNLCICACGNWVCTAVPCDGTADFDPFETYDVHQGPLPSKEERQALLKGFQAAEFVSLDQVEEEITTIPKVKASENIIIPAKKVTIPTSNRFEDDLLTEMVLHNEENLEDSMEDFHDGYFEQPDRYREEDDSEASMESIVPQMSDKNWRVTKHEATDRPTKDKGKKPQVDKNIETDHGDTKNPEHTGREESSEIGDGFIPTHPTEPLFVPTELKIVHSATDAGSVEPKESRREKGGSSKERTPDIISLYESVEVDAQSSKQRHIYEIDDMHLEEFERKSANKDSQEKDKHGSLYERYDIDDSTLDIKDVEEEQSRNPSQYEEDFKEEDVFSDAKDIERFEHNTDRVRGEKGKHRSHHGEDREAGTSSTSPHHHHGHPHHGRQHVPRFKIRVLVESQTQIAKGQEEDIEIEVEEENPRKYMSSIKEEDENSSEYFSEKEKKSVRSQEGETHIIRTNRNRGGWRERRHTGQ